MARLRDIEGVTRVSLSKSDSQKYESSTDSGSSIARRNAAPCGIGNRPQFEIVMFFQTVSAAVSAPPAANGSTTATATPTPTPTPTPSGTKATKSPTTTTAEEAK
jgi:hypothetical protein